ncbi:hypothetical protein SLEP1_g36215 [Rubroshorea leprosula]|uniref:Uncharacterized protein n=1 Tax=Rubroshorea leprosula TaxID=152421 RepID=A0AAV5KR66_9ROSI|nr:hypothetical protein SLEP1_g36215 [Rubroshorea leprosula]
MQQLSLETHPPFSSARRRLQEPMHQQTTAVTARGMAATTGDLANEGRGEVGSAYAIGKAKWVGD